MGKSSALYLAKKDTCFVLNWYVRSSTVYLFCLSIHQRLTSFATARKKMLLRQERHCVRALPQILLHSAAQKCSITRAGTVGSVYLVGEIASHREGGTTMCNMLIQEKVTSQELHACFIHNFQISLQKSNLEPLENQLRWVATLAAR